MSSTRDIARELRRELGNDSPLTRRDIMRLRVFEVLATETLRAVLNTPAGSVNEEETQIRMVEGLPSEAIRMAAKLMDDEDTP